MNDIRNELKGILKAEVKPSLGGAIPATIAVACAKARELLDEDIEEMDLQVSSSIYKSTVTTGIPGTTRKGLAASAAIAITGGNSELGLKVLESATAAQIKEAERLYDDGLVKIKVADTNESVYASAAFKGKNNTSKAIVKYQNDHLAYAEKNGKILLDTLDNNINNCETLNNTTIAEIIENVEKMEKEDLMFLLDGANMNLAMANYSIEHRSGLGMAAAIKDNIEKGILGDDIMNNAMMLTSAASEARMSGVKMPVMSSYGSGNQGLVTTLPIAAYNQKFKQSDERLVKALAISHLMLAYIKSKTGRLTTICSSAVMAGTGCSAALTWLMGGNEEQIEGAVKNMIGDTSGMICDGAKPGCAVKMATAAASAVQNAVIASSGSYLKDPTGIVTGSADDAVRALCKINTEGMSNTNDTMLDIILDK